MAYTDSVKNAADRALKLMKTQDRGLAIWMAADEYQVSTKDVAKELSGRKRKKSQDKKRKLKNYGDSSEKCRECGQRLSFGDRDCPLCGADTSWVWPGTKSYSGLTLEDIMVHLKKLCESGLRPSEKSKLRKSIRALSNDMFSNSKMYSEARDKDLLIEVKRKK
jgi:hypothetical protein